MSIGDDGEERLLIQTHKVWSGDDREALPCIVP